MTGIWDRSVSTDTTLGGRPAAPPPWVTLSAASDPVQVEASHFVDGPPTPRLRLLVHLQNRSLEPIEDCRLLARSAGTVSVSLLPYYLPASPADCWPAVTPSCGSVIWQPWPTGLPSASRHPAPSWKYRYDCRMFVCTLEETLEAVFPQQRG
jgi:hypothetical protein